MNTSFKPMLAAIAVLSIYLGLPVWGQQPGPEVVRVKSRLVEVYATVYDSGGHYVDNLGRERFQVLEDGKPQPIASFETNVERLSCAILLDTTGSMASTLPRVKNAVTKLIDALGPNDTVAIYSFDRQVTLRQEFTTDKASAKRAVLRLRAEGETALFDSISQVAQEAATQPGKKALVVFTDGDDNASLLNSSAAVARAQNLGIPLYTIAEGEALQAPHLKKLLKQLSETTGGLAYEAKKTTDIEGIFHQISRDLQHQYLISYKPPTGPGAGKWRKIDVSISGLRDYKIRAKQGYAME
jgi:Ca-activated chloride channel homolog